MTLQAVSNTVRFLLEKYASYKSTQTTKGKSVSVVPPPGREGTFLDFMHFLVNNSAAVSVKQDSPDF